jgi:hypothetical protein
MAKSTGVFYLPHHLVKEERRGKLKWRIAFVVSSSEVNSPSYIDVLEMGPNILPEVLAALLGIRRLSVAIIGHIQQASSSCL